MSDLSDSTWSEIDANNNNAAPNGWPEGMMPSGVNDAARADKGALKRFWDKINPVQLITPSGGVYTFVTANVAYPTAYIPGEIYSFKPNANCNAGDLFQVNALGAKPIWKRATAGSWVPIIAQDILVGVPPLLLYNNVLNGGTGVFVLLNPFVPISGDGAGGVSMPGALAVTGPVSATGYTSRSGVSGPSQTNLYNLQWDGAAAHLWIDAVDQGPIVTGSAGNIVIGGNISAGSITASGNITASGTVSAAAGTISGQLTVGNGLALTGHLQVTGDAYITTNLGIGGNVSTNGSVSVGSNFVIANMLTANQSTPVTVYTQFVPNANAAWDCGIGGQAWLHCTAYNFPNPSDPAVKRDIEPVPSGCLDLVKLIEPKTYKWIVEREDERDKIHWGFLAPEIADVMKRAGRKFDAVRTENEVTTLNYNEMLAVLWRAVQELAERIE